MKDTCKHYIGTFYSEACAAGVRYEEVTVPGNTPTVNRMPCFKGRCPAAKCEKLEFPTAEEVAEAEREMEEAFDRALQVRRAINDAVAAGAPERGQMGCPICIKGSLHYHVTKPRGHVHAKCTTPLCINFME